MIRALLAARYVTFSAVMLLLLALAWFGKRVGYEQSINSFFAEDDRYMAVYQQAAKTFGDDNFIFLVYDDPALVSPQGLERVSEAGCRSRLMTASRRCSASNRSTPCRCFGRSTTPCWRSTGFPGLPATWRLNAAPKGLSRTST